MLDNAIYTGTVFHQRILPKRHAFQYRMTMFYLSLSDLEKNNRLGLVSTRGFFRLASFRRCDHMHHDDLSLSESIKKEITEQTGHTFNGQIFVLTQLRYFGFYFSPLNVYYCWNNQKKLEFIVCEVSNTPWLEKKCYVNVINEDGGIDPTAKAFHVSPFLPMDMEYAWSFSEPGKALKINIKNWQNDNKVFIAHMQLKARAFNPLNTLVTLVKNPIMTLQVVLKIYWQAVRIWMKKIPFYDHPGHNSISEKQEEL